LLHGVSDLIKKLTNNVIWMKMTEEEEEERRRRHDDDDDDTKTD
jgi:hypothetical protein